MNSAILVIFSVICTSEALPNFANNFVLETVSTKGAISMEDLTLSQQMCLMQAYHKNSCKVMEALIFCGKINGGWFCLKQLPEIGACSKVSISFIKHFFLFLSLYRAKMLALSFIGKILFQGLESNPEWLRWLLPLKQYLWLLFATLWFGHKWVPASLKSFTTKLPIWD